MRHTIRTSLIGATAAVLAGLLGLAGATGAQAAPETLIRTHHIGIGGGKTAYADFVYHDCNSASGGYCTLDEINVRVSGGDTRQPSLWRVTRHNGHRSDGTVFYADGVNWSGDREYHVIVGIPKVVGAFVVIATGENHSGIGYISDTVSW